MSSFSDKIKSALAYIKNNWLRILTAPIVRCPGLFVCLATMMVTMPLVICFNFNIYEIRSIMANCILGITSETIVTTCAILAAYLLLRRWRRWASVVWLVIWFVICSANFLLDFIVWYVYNRNFNEDIASVLCATDTSEGFNFFTSYMTGELYRLMAIYAAIFAASYFVGKYAGKLCKRLFSGRRSVRVLRVVILSVIVAACILMCEIKSNRIKSLGIRSKVRTFCIIDTGHELETTNLPLVADSGAAPAKLVVVIGESHCRSHSSIYGYRLPTQPEQEKMVADSSLYVFQNAVAPALHTIACFERFIGLWNGEEDKKYYEQFTFLEAARRSGYKLYWLSNQSSKGVYDNPVVKMSEYCDVVHFCNDGMFGLASGNVDWKVYEPISQYVGETERQFFVVHLMGSHSAYKLRYPLDYAKFTPADHPGRTNKQSKNLSEYDNSIYYNDHVLSEIYSYFEDTDAVIVYFSDHAQDLYVTRPDFCGHSNDNDPKSKAEGEAVPLTIYLTKTYKQLHPESAKRIAAASQQTDSIFLTDLTYTLMDIMGTRFRDNDDVAKRSFLR